MTTPTREETIERRMVALTELRVEPAGDGEAGIGRLLGHAGVFNVLSEDLGGFRELVQPGAFIETIGADDIRALFNHNPSAILGRNKAGTLRLAEDRVGLAIDILLPDTSVARDLRESVNRGDVTQMSFGFRALDDIWEHTAEDEPDLRRLRKVQLFDVSPATFPAYPQTDIAVRSLEAWRAERDAAARTASTPRLDAAKRALLR